MNNPWLEIPLSDYESHISMPAIAQAQMIADEFSDALLRYNPESVAVIGCAGGNGFDRIPASTRRVVGVDINPDYVAAASARYLGRIPGIEFHIADIQTDILPFAPVDLIYAALVFEYVSVADALRNLSRVCLTGGRLVALLQQPSATMHAVSPSPYTSIQLLCPVMRLVPPADMESCAASCGFQLESTRSVVLESGKAFVIQVYR